MVFKKNKTNISLKIAAIVKREAPNMTFEVLLRLPIDSPVYSEIQKTICQKRGRYQSLPSLVRRTILRNKHTLSMYLDNHHNIETNMVPSEQAPSSVDKSLSMSKVNQSTPTKTEDALVITDISPVFYQQLEKMSPLHCVTHSNNQCTSIMHNSLEYFNVSTEKFNIPECLENLSYASSSPTTPLGKNLYVQKSVPSYKDCNFFEGCFDITQEQWDTICKNNKLIGFYYPYYIRNQIFKKVNSACQLSMKYVKYPKKSGCINIFAECIHNERKCKKFKIVLKHLRAFVYSSSRDYYHPKKLTTYLRGVERSLAKRNILHRNAFEYKKATVIKAKHKPLTYGNLQKIKSDATLRKVKSEATSLLDRAKDDLVDLFLMQQQHQDYLQEVCTPFNVKMYSKQQLSVLQNEKNDHLPLIYFDATGNIVRKPAADCKRVFMYTAVIRLSQAGRIFPVFDMISADHHAKTIFKIFNDFRTFCEEENTWPSFGGIVTDFSFATLHAASKAFNRKTLLEYLEFSYECTKNDSNLPFDFVTIHLCCSHFIKMVAKDAEKFSKEFKSFFVEVIAAAVLFTNLKDIDLWVENISILMKSKNHGVHVEEALRILRGLCRGEDHLEIKKETCTATSEATDLSDDINSEKQHAMFRSSPFYKHFYIISSSIITDKDGTPNKFYNPEFLEIILSKYLPYYCLWGGIMLYKKGYNLSRISNAPIENYFGYIKHNLLKDQKNLKPSRLIRSLRANVLALYKEANIDIKKSKLTSRKTKTGPVFDKEHDSERCSQEEWNKKRSSPFGYFSGKYFKQDSIHLKKSSNLLDYNFTKCIYCREGTFQDSEPTDWVLCDVCEGWVHQKCLPLDLSFSGNFLCNYCDSRLNDLQYSLEDTSFSEKCENYLNALGYDIAKIADDTVDQNQSSLWHDERRKRITSSLFGRVFKARTESSLNTIANEIVFKKPIHTIAMSHGCRYESVALQLYIRQSSLDCVKSGLIVHPEFPFLGASPDALVGNEGLLEIKCPYKTRNLAIKNAHLGYLDTNGNLKKTHNYFFQIQGLLEITGRGWCDFMIYTHKDFSIERIYRNKDIFNTLLPKLKAFYYYHVLPLLISPDGPLTNKRVKWTLIKSLKFLDNGLVDDIDYYKYLPSKKGYTVAIYSAMPVSVKEIIISDYSSLNDHEWLTDFLIDISMNLINVNNEYQIIPCNYSTILLASTTISEHILREIKITKRKLVLPLLVNGNHWCLAIADIDGKKFSFFDPLGSSIEKSQQYLKRFANFIAQYNRRHEAEHNISVTLNEWQVDLKHHILQEDSFNCGVFIIYFFECLVTGSSLICPSDMNSYRHKLKKLILKKSDDMKYRCLLCVREINIADATKCNFCHRWIHKKCLALEKEFNMTYNMCELCRIYE